MNLIGMGNIEKIHGPLIQKYLEKRHKEREIHTQIRNLLNDKEINGKFSNHSQKSE